MMSEFVVNGPPADRRDMIVHVGGIAALALVLVGSGAFDSGDLPLARRLLMFGIVSALLVAQVSAVAGLARRYLKPSLIGTAMAFVLAIATTLLLMTLEIHLLKATPIVPYEPDPLPGFALFLAPFVIPAGAFVLGLKWLSGAGDVSHARASAVPSGRRDISPPAFDDPIEYWPQEPILRVRAADHYLELWTPLGISLVRGRMRDALRRLPTSGIQPHRSWWVATSEIQRIERRGRDLFLLMKGGDRLPVARARAREVRLSVQGRRKR